MPRCRARISNFEGLPRYCDLARPPDLWEYMVDHYSNQSERLLIRDDFTGIYLSNLSCFGMTSTGQQSYAFCDVLTLPTCLGMTSLSDQLKICLLPRTKLLQKVVITLKVDLISIKSTITFFSLLHLAQDLADIILIYHSIL